VVRAQGGARRREVLGGAGATLAAGAAVVLAGCGHKGAIPRKAEKKAPPHVQRRDVELLNAALYLERRTIAAYTAGIPLLNHKLAKGAKQFLNEELQHTGELLALIKAAGGVAIPRAASYDLGDPKDAHGVLSLLHELERLQVAHYLDAISKLSPAPVRAAVATILANDAQHISIIRLQQGLNPLPSAFVTGNE
jgi:hypothetical protein